MILVVAMIVNLFGDYSDDFSCVKPQNSTLQQLRCRLLELIFWLSSTFFGLRWLLLPPCFRFSKRATSCGQLKKWRKRILLTTPHTSYDAKRKLFTVFNNRTDNQIVRILFWREKERYCGLMYHTDFKYIYSSL